MRRCIAYIAALTAGCFGGPAMAADYVLNISAGESQCQRFSDGWKFIDDEQRLSAVRIRQPREALPKQSGFIVYVVNTGDRAFNFGPENVTINLSDGTLVTMMRFDDLMLRQSKSESRQKFRMALRAIGRTLETSNAGYTSGSFTYSGTSSGTGSFSSYNSGQAYAVQALVDEQNRRDIQTMRLNQAARRVELAQVMKTTTVDSGQVFGGLVQYKVPKAVQSSKVQVPVTIEIRTGDEVHSFLAGIGKSGAAATALTTGDRQSQPANCVRRAAPLPAREVPVQTASEQLSEGKRKVIPEARPQITPQNGLNRNARIRCITCR